MKKSAISQKVSHVLGALMVSLAMVFSFALVGCSSTPKTLEEYMNTEQGKQEMDKLQQQADSMASAFGKMDLAVQGNNILYTVTFDQTFEENPFKDGAFDDATIQELAKAIEDMEKETGVSGCTMEYVFKDSAGTVLADLKIDKSGKVA